MKITKSKNQSTNNLVIELTPGKLIAIAHGLRALGENKTTKLTTLQAEILVTTESYLKANNH